MESSDLSGTKRVYEVTSGNSDDAIKKTRLFENLEDLEKELVSKLNINLNRPFIEEDNDVGKCNQIVYGLDLDLHLNGPFNEDINIDDDDDKMKGIKCTIDLDLHLGMNEVCVERRCSNEDKRKAQVEDEFFNLSLPYESKHLDMIYNAKGKAKADDNVSSSSSSPAYEFQQFDMLNDALELDAVKVMESMAAMTLMPQDVQCSIYKERGSTSKTEIVGDYTHITSKDDFLCEYENGMIFYKRLDFSGELRDIIDRNTEEKAEQLIDWSPRRVDFSPHARSLVDLSFDVLAKNPYSITSFEHVPIWIKRSLMNSLCDTRKLDVRILELLFGCSPSEICVNNCSWMTENLLADMLRKPNMQNLRVLQLDYWQCSFANIIPKSLIQDTYSLPCLSNLSLKGAARLCDYTLKRFLVSAPSLQSINLNQCSLLTHEAINMIANYLKTNLKELNIDDCSRIDVMHRLSSMVTFEHLEVLTVAGSDTVCDEFVKVITKKCGKKLKSLNLASCVQVYVQFRRLTNKCLQAIGEFCPALCALDISNLCKITDLGTLADGCKLLDLLKVAHDDFSDEVVAAFLETSGGSLTELSLDHVVKVSFKTACAVAKYSTNLECLNLSGCHQLTNEALGFITDNCSYLKVLNIFGCTQVTERFLLGHGNSQLQIVR